MADQLKNLKYVENYNYSISTSANSDTISKVELTATDDSQGTMGFGKPEPHIFQQFLIPVPLFHYLQLQLI